MTLTTSLKTWRKTSVPLIWSKRLDGTSPDCTRNWGKMKMEPPMMVSKTILLHFKTLLQRPRLRMNFTASTPFSTGLDQQITTIILSMTTQPDDIEGWIDKVKLFSHKQTRIDDLNAGNCFSSFHSNPSSSFQPAQDPMNVDSIMLKKMLQMQKGWTQTKKLPTNHNRTLIPPPSSTTSSQDWSNPWNLSSHSNPNPFCFHHLCSDFEKELLQTLKICYEKPVKKVAVATTFESEGFWNRKLPQHHLPIVLPVYL